jgi:hypothetical protein
MRRNRVEQNGTIFQCSQKGSSISYSSNSTTDVDVRHAFLCRVSALCRPLVRLRYYSCGYESSMYQ